jgi:hypothetical protein
VCDVTLFVRVWRLDMRSEKINQDSEPAARSG